MMKYNTCVSYKYMIWILLKNQNRVQNYKKTIVWQ